jgi:hypothetical protein
MFPLPLHLIVLCHLQPSWRQLDEKQGWAGHTRLALCLALALFRARRWLEADISYQLLWIMDYGLRIMYQGSCDGKDHLLLPT